VNDEHRKFLDLIPWYVNGTLSDAERVPLERHLGSCLPCHSALKEEERVRRLLRAQPDLPLGSAHAMAGLLERIERRGPRRGARLGRRALFLGYGAAAVLGGALVWLAFIPTPGPTGGPEAFTTLSASGASKGDRIDVVFAEPIGEAGLEGFVAELGGALVGGPSEIGRYTIALPESRAADLDVLLAELRDDPRIRFAGRSFVGETEVGEDPR
jgi:hypothetical protein